MLGITVSKLREATPPTASVTLLECNYEHMPSKSTNGGALLYIKNDINYKLRPDLNVNKDKELEPIFIENPAKNSKIFFLAASLGTFIYNQKILIILF